MFCFCWRKPCSAGGIAERARCAKTACYAEEARCARGNAAPKWPAMPKGRAVAKCLHKRSVWLIARGNKKSGNERIMDMDKARLEKIKALAKKKDTVILAHYYVNADVQEVADFVGDSYFLSKVATKVLQQNILFCGVSFMGECAKLLNPKKRVILPDETADCPMAHMVTPERIAQVRGEWDDLAVVCYVNSTAEIKAVSDVCVTSSNAVRVVRNIKEKNIFFVPDSNLGRFVAQQVPEKHFIFHDGFCHVHTSILAEDVKKAKQLSPNALVLTHPECTLDVIELSDFVGSTSEIIVYAAKSNADKFIVCTEMGVFYELQQNNPEKKFYSVGRYQFCSNMKKITLDKVERALETLSPVIELDENTHMCANEPLIRMLELAEK